MRTSNFPVLFSATVAIPISKIKYEERSLFSKTKQLLFICMALVIGFFGCRKAEMERVEIDDSFFDKSIVMSDGKLVNSPSAFIDPVSKEIDESWIDRTIQELKKLESRDHYVSRIKARAGLPVWNESLVFTGGDGKKTIITPLYTTQAKVNGALFGFFETNGKFNAQILSKEFAVKHLKDTSRTTRTVSRSTLTGLLRYFETRESANKPVLQSNLNTVTTLDNPTNIVYTVCWYVPVVVYAPSTVVFEKQCHTEVFYGTFSEWDYYYSNGSDFIDQSEGYYETYDENTIEKGIENVWEREHIDTINMPNNPCLRAIVIKIMNNPNNDWGRTVSKLFASVWGAANSSAYDYNIKFDIKPSLPDNRAAQTFFNGHGLSTIQISAEVFNHCTDLYAASVLIHEFSHAFLQQMLSMHTNADTSTLKDFKESFLAYERWVYDETMIWAHDDNITQHELMANNFVNLMAKALQEFDNSPGRDPEFYWKLSWGSLQDTPTWKYYWDHPMTSESQKSSFWYSWDYALTADRMLSIKSVITAEQENNNALGHVNNCY